MPEMIKSAPLVADGGERVVDLHHVSLATHANLHRTNYTKPKTKNKHLPYIEERTLTLYQYLPCLCTITYLILLYIYLSIPPF